MENIFAGRFVENDLLPSYYSITVFTFPFSYRAVWVQNPKQKHKNMINYTFKDLRFVLNYQEMGDFFIQIIFCIILKIAPAWIDKSAGYELMKLLANFDV